MKSFLIDPFLDNAFLGRSLLAGVLVALTCAVAGTYVVLRGLAFVGDALAHGVLPGIAGALLLGMPVVLGAVVGTAAMMGGVAVVQRRSRLSADTAVGLLFVGMLALGVVITSRSQSFSGDLTAILFGEVLGVSAAALAWQAAVLVAVAVTGWWCRRPFLLLCVDEDLTRTSGFRAGWYHAAMLAMVAATVIASFQTVGTLLVLGMLIAPAATAALVVRRVGQMIALAAALGTIATYAGLVVSYHADLAAGASIVLCSVVVFVVVFVAVEIRRGATGPSAAAVHTHGEPHR